MSDEMHTCQARKHCGYRVCREYRGYWFCLVWCWRSRVRIYANVKDLERYGEER